MPTLIESFPTIPKAEQGGPPWFWDGYTPWSHPNKEYIHLSYNGAFTLDGKSVLNENLGGILGGMQC
jgi:hypothetical protein